MKLVDREMGRILVKSSRGKKHNIYHMKNNLDLKMR